MTEARRMARLIGSLTRRRALVMPIAMACAAGAAFWLPAAGAARGYFPAPLDDVYIHFDFARSLATGHPFEWIPGQGFSSGETSPLYAAVLAVGCLLGFHGRALGVWAALVAIASVATLLATVRRWTRPAPPWLAWIIAALPLSIGIADWTLFSGMEVALFVALLARALAALARVRDPDRGGPTRARREWTLGAWGAALVLARPEATIVVAVLGLFAALGAGRRSALAVLVRAGLPGAVATGAVLGVNLLATGDAQSAGAQLKLLSSNPYLSEIERARAFVGNLVIFWVKVVRGELAVTPALAWTLPALGVCALFRREHRPIAGAALASALGWTLLVSWNGNAPFQNFRYYAPALVLLAIAAALGVSTIVAHARSRATRAGGALVGLAAIAAGAGRVPAQAAHFRDATANIRDQQIEAGERLARLPKDARVLLGDAGAIPFVSGRTAIDALGLGGYHGMPFARAAVHGEPAIVELIERLAPAERPTHLALYPTWFGTLISRFGVELDRVTIDHNVICGGPTKVIARADWSALATGDEQSASVVVDELDVADVIDEAAHAYAPPIPGGGWTTLDILADATGARRFDGGRIIPEGRHESFVVRAGARGPLVLRMRVDAGARGIVLRTARTTIELALEPVREGAWRHATAELDGVEAGEILTLEASRAPYQSYHLWIERSGLAR